MRYGNKPGPEYFDDYDPQAARVDVHHVFRPTTVDHDPTLDDFHRRIHVGALGVIRTYRDCPEYASLVLNARRLLEHDIHAAGGGDRTRLVDELTAALAGQ